MLYDTYSPPVLSIFPLAGVTLTPPRAPPYTSLDRTGISGVERAPIVTKPSVDLPMVHACPVDGNRHVRRGFTFLLYAGPLQGDFRGPWLEPGPDRDHLGHFQPGRGFRQHLRRLIERPLRREIHIEPVLS